MAVSVASLSAATPPGWLTIKDKTGVCQMSVPPSWSLIPSSPDAVSSPEHVMSVLISGYHRDSTPMTDAKKRELGADKIIENSATLWLYAGKPTAQNAITYHVNVPTANRACVAELAVKVGHSEDEIKKIAATVGSTK
jgi:hypothetical protein